MGCYAQTAHPRSRGENALIFARRRREYGSSPLTRGKLDPHAGDGAHRGLIPAHAGKTSPRTAWRATTRAHPRSRGENLAANGVEGYDQGSSPLTRGKRPRGRHMRCRDRLIPAHAGKTASMSASAFAITAHPRSRGENGEKWDTATPRGGSSPLTRGKRRCAAYRDGGGRLIPAHAGKTAPETDGAGALGTHPRSRGENSLLSRRRCPGSGSSPLTRGKLMWDGMFLSSFRLIPAHAGKTTVAALALHGNAAHPRSRGENEDEYGIDPMDSGSSPLTRGKPAQGRDRARNARLIPAHAGKTPEPVPSPLPKPAHPRSRGENGYSWSTSSTSSGSSPLTRGKRDRREAEGQAQRLIPAHAGKTGPTQ